VDDENGTQVNAHARLLTANQVVAWNLARFRGAAGLRQRELGEILGWTNQAVSEAERSFDGKRIRQFDAQELTEIALALGVPLIALFLPPDDDGDSARYFVAGAGGKEHDMADLMARAVMPDSDDDAPAMQVYRNRLRAAVTRYLDPEWADDLAGWLREVEDDDLLADRAERLRAQGQQLMDAAIEFGTLASAIESRRSRK
jgi:transcriptional regulator with XRE-family HTH domain